MKSIFTKKIIIINNITANNNKLKNKTLVTQKLKKYQKIIYKIIKKTLKLTKNINLNILILNKKVAKPFKFPKNKKN